MYNRTLITMAAGLAWLAVLPFAAIAQDAGIQLQAQTMPPADTASVQADASTASDTTFKTTASGDTDSPAGKRLHHAGGAGQFKAIADSLTPEQQQQMADVRSQLKDETAPLRKQMKELRAKLQAAPQGSDVSDVQKQMADLRAQLKEQMKAGRQKMMAILTDDQKAQLKAAHKQQKSEQNNSSENSPTPSSTAASQASSDDSATN
jgi:Spy/CpxP family protein refolding chaperone